MVSIKTGYKGIQKEQNSLKRRKATMRIALTLVAALCLASVAQADPLEGRVSVVWVALGWQDSVVGGTYMYDVWLACDDVSTTVTAVTGKPNIIEGSAGVLGQYWYLFGNTKTPLNDQWPSGVTEEECDSHFVFGASDLVTGGAASEDNDESVSVNTTDYPYESVGWGTYLRGQQMGTSNDYSMALDPTAAERVAIPGTTEYGQKWVHLAVKAGGTVTFSAIVATKYPSLGGATLVSGMTAPVPEPGTLILLGLGGMAALLKRRRS
jgi:hypothetical protein